MGLGIFKSFLDGSYLKGGKASAKAGPEHKTTLTKRIIACLDVRSNDNGDIVVTKGDQYNCREEASDGKEAHIRNLVCDLVCLLYLYTCFEGCLACRPLEMHHMLLLVFSPMRTFLLPLFSSQGKPVELAKRYFDEGADEVTFLNITSFRDDPLGNAPMLEVLRRTSECVFVPLCIGGGIRAYKDATGKEYSALDVASHYFRAGADKISLGSDAVYAAEDWMAAGGLEGAGDKAKTGKTSIETISHHYGVQAVVVSVDPRRVYVKDPKETTHHCVEMTDESRYGPNGERYAWYQCTVKGGREGRDLDAWQLAKGVEALGCGELLVNCIDNDGQKAGFDIDLLNDLTKAVSIPAIASSGAGNPDHFVEVFSKTRVEAGLAAGIFHHKLVAISAVKQGIAAAGFGARL